MTVHHYSQVQVSTPMLQEAFKVEWNKLVSNSGDANHALHLRGRPYAQVKLLPDTNWAQVIKQYMRKQMTTPTATA